MARDCAAAAQYRWRRGSQPARTQMAQRELPSPVTSAATFDLQELVAWPVSGGTIDLSNRTGRDPVRQRSEALELILPQCAGLVAPDKHLEHDPAIDIDERDKGRRLPHERPLAETDRAQGPHGEDGRALLPAASG